MDEYEKLLVSITTLAIKVAPNYPNIESVDPSEQLYAIDTAVQGLELANEDLFNSVSHLQKRLGTNVFETLALIQAAKEKLI